MLCIFDLVNVGSNYIFFADDSHRRAIVPWQRDSPGIFFVAVFELKSSPSLPMSPRLARKTFDETHREGAFN